MSSSSDSCGYSVLQRGLLSALFLCLFVFPAVSRLAGAGPAPEEIKLHGRVEPRFYEKYYLGPGESVVRAAARNGQTVHTGDLLFAKCSPALAQSAADLSERLSRLTDDLLADDDLERERQVLTERSTRLDTKRNAAAGAESYLDRTEAEALRAARENAQLRLARVEAELKLRRASQSERAAMKESLAAHLAELRRQIAALEVRAPFDGVVEHRLESDGTGRAGELIMEFWQPGPLNVRVEVWAAHRHSVKAGLQVVVLADSAPAHQTTGTIVSVDGIPASREGGFSKFEALIELAADTSGLTPGDPVNIALPLAPAKP